MVTSGDPSKANFRSMGEPSWLILKVLDPDDAIPASEIVRRVEQLLAAADYPLRHLDPSTLHHALTRMQEDGIVRGEAPTETDGPGLGRRAKREPRRVYTISELGAEMLGRRRRLESFFRPAPWPRKGDQLFRSDGDWRHRAGINARPDRWNMYAEGYKRAADQLVKDIMAAGGRTASFDLDFLVYPIVFLYRQYLESSLKQLLADTRHLFDSDLTSKQTTHKIDDMWREFRRLTQQDDWPQEEAAVLDVVQDLITQFSKVDPASFAFRYPTDKKGRPSLGGPLSSIDLRNLSEVMERLATFFDGAIVGTAEYLNAKYAAQTEGLPYE